MPTTRRRTRVAFWDQYLLPCILSFIRTSTASIRQMVPMMESIAGELCERVMRVINFRTLFSSHPEDVKRRADDAKQMMDLWKSSYLGMRARIEAAGCDARWEFDRKKLFENTECIAAVCQDIANVAQV